MSLRIWHEISAKRTNEVTFPAGGWHRIDVEADPDPVSGLVWHMGYFNTKPRWKTAGLFGMVYVRFVRHNDPDGDTGYHRYLSIRGLNASWFPMQPTHFEAGRRGIGGHWEVKVGGGLSGVAMTTRYAKSMGIGE